MRRAVQRTALAWTGIALLVFLTFQGPNHADPIASLVVVVTWGVGLIGLAAAWLLIPSSDCPSCGHWMSRATTRCAACGESTLPPVLLARPAERSRPTA